jgi:hypothetical protein
MQQKRESSENYNKTKQYNTIKDAKGKVVPGLEPAFSRQSRILVGRLKETHGFGK